MIVSYMGTKRHLAHHVRTLASDCPAGPLLDGFAGMCAIGHSLAKDRQVWSNDLQAFAHEVATAQFCSSNPEVGARFLIEAVKPHFQANMGACTLSFALELQIEQSALIGRDLEAATDQFERSGARAQVTDSDYSCLPHHSLLTARYAGTYFGYMQACEGDSIRFGLDELKAANLIDEDTHRWGVIGLCSAMSEDQRAIGTPFVG